MGDHIQCSTDRGLPKVRSLVPLQLQSVGDVANLNQFGSQALVVPLVGPKGRLARFADREEIGDRFVAANVASAGGFRWADHSDFSVGFCTVRRLYLVKCSNVKYIDLP